VLERVGPRPSLAQLRAGVGSEEWLTALALLDLSPAVAGDAARYTEWSQDGGRFTYAGEGDDRVSTFHPDAEMDWGAWVNDVDQAGRGCRRAKPVSTSSSPRSPSLAARWPLSAYSTASVRGNGKRSTS